MRDHHDFVDVVLSHCLQHSEIGCVIGDPIAVEQGHLGQFLDPDGPKTFRTCRGTQWRAHFGNKRL